MNPARKLREQKNNARLVGVAAGLSLAFLLMLTHLLPLPIGYNGKLNIVRSRINALPNIEIIDERLNHDVFLEDFYFDVMIDDTQQISLAFDNADDRSIISLLAQVDQVGTSRWGWPAFVGWLISTTIALIACVIVGWFVSRTFFRINQRRKNHSSDFCSHCGYDITGNKSGTCPECGHAR